MVKEASSGQRYSAGFLFLCDALRPPRLCGEFLVCLRWLRLDFFLYDAPRPLRLCGESFLPALAQSSPSPRGGAKAQSDPSSLMFSLARRPLGTRTLSLNGNAAKRRQEGRNSRKRSSCTPSPSRSPVFLPFLSFPLFFGHSRSTAL